MKVKLKNIVNTSREILEAIGLPEDNAAIIAETIDYAHSLNLHTHGIGRIPLYVNNINSGTIDPNAVMCIEKETETYALINANNGFGQIAAKKAVRVGVNKALLSGISMVGVKNSNNFGASGYYGHIAADNGLICQIYSNASPAVAPAGGNAALFGTNPICFAMPGTEQEANFVFDIATTVAARGKIRLAAKEGKPIPGDWALDTEGKPTTDPNEALEGTLLAIGGNKGALLSLMVDALAGMLTGSAFAGEVRPLSDTSSFSRNGHLFIFIDPNNFLSNSEYSAAYNTLIQNIRQTGPDGSIYIPGENYAKIMQSTLEVVDLPQVQFDEVNELAKKYNVSPLLASLSND